MNIHRFCILFALSILPWWGYAQSMAYFKGQIPAGNYSGICPIGNDLYAVVDDKAPTDGFHVFHIAIDHTAGRIVQINNLGYRSCGLPNRDMEGICYRPSTNTVFISGEQDNQVYEYTLEGQRTGKRLQMPDDIQKAESNYGLEALTYDTHHHRFLTTTEHPLPGETHLRLLAFDDSLNLQGYYLYQPDAPISSRHTHGVSALCALSNGRLLVLERQVRIPRLKIGATTITRIYEIHALPTDFYSPLSKHLICEFKTRLTLTGRKFANFEGLCQVSPNLLLLVADSQNQYKGILRDWFRIERIK